MFIFPRVFFSILLGTFAVAGVTALAPDFVSRLEAEASLRGFPAVGYAVVEQGKVVATGAVGAATGQSLFGLGSLSKPITARLIRGLAREGLVDLQAPVSRYVPELGPPEFPEAVGITVQMLLDQTSGFGFYDGHDGFNRAEPTPVPRRLWHTPGTTFEYSNWNYNVLGLVATAVTGLPYDQVLGGRLADPWGMPSLLEPYPAGYRRIFGLTVLNPGMPHPEGFRPSGLLAASPEDLGRFLERTLAEGLPPGHLYYQDGWFRDWQDGVETRFHSGTTADFAAHVLLVPVEGFGIVLIANINNYLESPAWYRFLENTARTAAGLKPWPELNTPPWGLVFAGLALFIVVLQGGLLARGFVRRRRRSLVQRTIAAASALGWVAVLAAAPPLLLRDPWDTIAWHQPDAAAVIALSAGLALLSALVQALPARPVGHGPSKVA